MPRVYPLDHMTPEEKAEHTRQKRNANSKRWDAKNRDKKLAITQAWRAANPERNRENYLAYNRRRYNEDEAFRLLHLLRCRVYKALKSQAALKNGKTLELTGCTVLELRAHLEKLFLPDMNWDNMGQWHVDHVKPCKGFNLDDVEQQKLCFHYTNLQPLWALDNKRKGTKTRAPVSGVPS